MRKIALIMEGWKRYITYAWPAGILQKMKESDEEISRKARDKKLPKSERQRYKREEKGRAKRNIKKRIDLYR